MNIEATLRRESKGINELTMSLGNDPLYFGACHCCQIRWFIGLIFCSRFNQIFFMPFEYYTNPNHVKDIEIEREREKF